MKKIIFHIILVVSTFSFAQISKVEPPFWYENMEHNELQIMFYGKNISQNTVSVSNHSITNITKTDNPNYLFVTINTKNIEASELVFTFKNKNTSFTQNYQIKKRKNNAANRESFDSADVIYLLMPDRFSNGNPNNDSHLNLQEKANRNLPGGRHGGDIQGIINHLDYIKNLGATAIWSTPLCEDNDKTFSYHTYAQSDVYKIDARYGSNEDYLKLSTELHQRGMKNIMDYVTNHWGAEHWMIKDLPDYNWIHQFPGYAQSNYRMTTQFDHNAAQIDAKYCEKGWFVSSMPDLNQENPFVLNYLIQNAIWWIEYADLDGFRVDTYSYNNKEAIAKWTKAITTEYPNFNIVGEVWMHNQAQMAYWQKNSAVGAIQNYNSNLPSVMDFTLHDAISVVFNEDKDSWDKGIIKVYENFANDFLYPNINNMLVFAENHDTNRFNDIYKNDFKKYQLALTLIATTRGIPQIYYGSEIGMNGNRDQNGDADIRKDFPGGWANDTNNAFTNIGRTAEQQKFYNFTSKLLNWRKTNTAIHNGKTLQFIPENNVYVYFRYNADKKVMVIINNNTKNQTIKTNRFAEIIGKNTMGLDVISNQNYNITETINIEAKSNLILEIN